MKYFSKGVGEFEIKTIILDLNGTLSVNGEIVEGVKERFDKLSEMGIEVFLFTGDQRGTAADICEELGIDFKKCSTTEEKENAFLEFDTETTAAIGNARIDIGTFKHAKISIGTLQAEGIHVGILEYIDILVPTINNALDVFINPNSMAATMRK